MSFPKALTVSMQSFLFERCRELIDSVVELSGQAAINVDDRDEVLLKLDGITDIVARTREAYVSALSHRNPLSEGGEQP